jgi:hypothetical protein
MLSLEINARLPAPKEGLNWPQSPTCFDSSDNDTRETPEILFIAPWNASFREGEDTAGHYMIPIFRLLNASPDVTSSTDPLVACSSVESRSADRGRY